MGGTVDLRPHGHLMTLAGLSDRLRRAYFGATQQDEQMDEAERCRWEKVAIEAVAAFGWQMVPYPLGVSANATPPK